MSERDLFDGLLAGWFVLSAVVFVALQFVSAPYGRHNRRGWGPQVPNALGWVLMELPAVALFAALFVVGDRHANAPAIAFLVMWELHYVHRTFVFPLRMRTRGKRIPLLIVAMAFTTNLGIDYLNARWLFTLGPERGVEWLADPRFIAGVLLFLGGFAVNVHSDHVLLRLRREREGRGYGVPFGGAYRWVSCPNYMGEIAEWCGWALATWSLPGLAFAVWTAANLVPRAMANHRWYRETFPDYPQERRALFPGLL
ncbi:MAG: DUF1295 domain-containing protein [Myxococcota bacterium]